MRWLTAAVLCAWMVSVAHATESIWDALREPGSVVVLRHAYAPGAFDPPDARLEDCSTQRNVENGLSENEFKLTARGVLELATIDGARSMGVDDRVGSLRPGKRADLLMVSTRAVNIGVFTDPAHMLVEAAQPSNVDTVVVDGRLLKRKGKLTAIDTGQVVSEASAALAGVRKRGNWW